MKYPKKLFFLTTLLAACLLIGGNAFAQSTLVTVEGTVTDDDTADAMGVKSMEMCPNHGCAHGRCCGQEDPL